MRLESCRTAIPSALLVVAMSATSVGAQPATHQANRAPGTSTPASNRTTQFGLQIDGPNRIVPAGHQLNRLGAIWERSVVGAASRSHSGLGVRRFRGAKPSLDTTFTPGARRLRISNNQSCSHDGPLGQLSPREWDGYIDGHYIPGLLALMNDNARQLVAKQSRAVFEIWNVENCRANNSFVPPGIYVGMLSKAAATVSAWDHVHHAGVQTIMGGLCNPQGEMDHDSSYLEKVLEAGRGALRTGRATGVHP